MAQAAGSALMPFLYPCLYSSSRTVVKPRLFSARSIRDLNRRQFHQSCHRCLPTLAENNAVRRAAAYDDVPPEPSPSEARQRRLNPDSTDYSRTPFIDKCMVTVHAGSGGNGCVAFHRDAFIPDGPPNGGDGGSGGNVWVQAVAGHTSLHKLARRGVIKAGRGIGGQGKSQGGRKGEDICIQVPVGTLVREIWRSDPTAEEAARQRELAGIDPEQVEIEPELKQSQDPRGSPWILYPGAVGREAKELGENLPPAPKPRRSHLAGLQPAAPINLDLDKPMEKPMLLAVGALGGLGNSHFATKGLPKPKYATKGDLGVRLKLQLELKLLADVGLVGLPNAGKSTLLRAISNSRTRVGDWAFTTLEPSIGTVVLDSNEGRPTVRSGIDGEGPRQNFTVADIPGLIEGAHLDKGLGLGFLRHIERARILSFVVDLSAGDAVGALKNLWKEVGEYENLRSAEINAQTESHTVPWSSFSEASPTQPLQSATDEDGQEILMFPEPSNRLEPIKLPPISAKPWFVVATKADKEGTQEEFTKLKTYVEQVESGRLGHPSGQPNAWRTKVAAIPVSALNGEGTDRIAEWTAGLLDSLQGAGRSQSVVSSTQYTGRRPLE